MRVRGIAHFPVVNGAFLLTGDRADITWMVWPGPRPGLLGALRAIPFLGAVLPPGQAPHFNQEATYRVRIADPTFTCGASLCTPVLSLFDPTPPPPRGPLVFDTGYSVQVQ